MRITLLPHLPIDEVLPELTRALREAGRAVLVAPPGAGKTTRVPLALLDEPWATGQRIVMLEPRRLAASAAAHRMAQTLGENVGATVGLRTRFDTRVSSRTRIEVVTEGVYSRLVLDDPELRGIGAVIFDEFHERSLDADLGLALTLDVRGALRPDLKLLVMSATLDGARVASLLEDAPVIESTGRSFPVETRHLGRDPAEPIERAVAGALRSALRTERGSVLAFLPGAAEIRRCERQLAENLPDDVELAPLYGTLDHAAQQRAIAPAPAGRRKVVLATAIAETSLTIDGVRVVVDSGLARRPHFEPDLGITRLDTVRVSRAAADQRRGRAGRTEPGVCLRLWDAPQTASLEPFAQPEILASDLSGLLLDLAAWGVKDPRTLSFLDPPPAAAWSAAQALARELGAVDADGNLTETGRRLRVLPLPLRLARMLLDATAEGAASLAADLALLITEPTLGSRDVDLAHRLQAVQGDRSERARTGRAMAERWAALATDRQPPSTPIDAQPGAVLARAFPDRVAQNRGDGSGKFLLANGRSAALDPVHPLAGEAYIVAVEVAGAAARGRIVSAAAVVLAEIEAALADRIEHRDELRFDRSSLRLQARRVRRLGSIALESRPVPAQPGANATAALLDAVRQIGIGALPWGATLRQWQARVAFLRRRQPDLWPDLSDTALAADLSWLEPALAARTGLDGLRERDLAEALEALLPWELRRRLDTEAPRQFTAPSGRSVPIGYEDGEPKVAVRVQDLFGLATHPSAGGVPLVIELLSPAGRPVQLTRDLPGFWRGSYAAVRKDMRGRYPKHPWPEDPVAATPPVRRR